MPKPRQIRYDPAKTAPTIAKFHRSKAFYRGIMGPRASAKSTGCCWEIMKRIKKQKPGPDNIRRTRFTIVRNTYRELKDTTLATWLHWFGPRNGMPKPLYTDMTWTYRRDDVDSKILFRALDRPQDIAKLLSMELTGAWINEAREIPRGIIDGLSDCVGRYPPLSDGGPTWHGIIMDTNPPDDTHWWYKLAEEDRPEGWEFFRQPGGLIETSDGVFKPNPKAENLMNLLGGAEWYKIRAAGKNKDHIRIYYCNQYGFLIEGRSVIPEYNDSIHCAKEILKPVTGHTIYVGLDFGLTPAAVFTQRLPDGRWIWFDEIISENMGIKRFAETELRPKIQGEYKDFDFAIYGDPAGNQRAQTDEETCFDLLNATGIPAEPACTNDFTIRREAIAEALGRLIDGKPGFLISPRCKVARKGLMGGYCYKQKQVSISGGEAQFKELPEKNRYSHPVEAGGYAMLGAGEGYNLISTPSTGLDDPNEAIRPPTSWAA